MFLDISPIANRLGFYFFVMNLFYAENIKPPVFDLPTEESKHIIRVLRKNNGDNITITDGKGSFYDCKIIDANPKHCTLEVQNTIPDENKRDYYIHIAIAPTKNIARTEWFLEKCTEIGIDEITPVITFNSERREIKLPRLEKVVISAMKQSLKATLPLLNEKTLFKHLIEKPFEGEKYIAWIDESVTNTLINVYPKGSNALILIGPEGDFTPEEVKDALKNGYRPVSLGKSRLRTETAGIVACDTISLANMKQ